MRSRSKAQRGAPGKSVVECLVHPRRPAFPEEPLSLDTTDAPLEHALRQALASAREGAPPRLLGAMHHAMFPAGGRVRPRLVRAVSIACGDSDPRLSLAAAVSIELLHSASLVHDDLPCFDDADTRRGIASVHRAFGEPLAVLAGDALIVLAFERLAECAESDPRRVLAVSRAIARGVGAPSGIVAGQAWECEPAIALETYHRAKAGALFAAAAAAGAIAAGADGESWLEVGFALGEAYQIADDLADTEASGARLGKPVRQDELHERPNAARALGSEGARARREALVARALASIPACEGRVELHRFIADAAARFLAVESADAAQ
jgi:geranylgeranyl diphosphate synthase type II